MSTNQPSSATLNAAVKVSSSSTDMYSNQADCSRKQVPIWQVAVIIIASIVLTSWFKHDRLSSYWQQTYQQTTVWNQLQQLPFWSIGLGVEQMLSSAPIVASFEQLSTDTNATLNQEFYGDVLAERARMAQVQASRLAAQRETQRLAAIEREQQRLIVKNVTIRPEQKVFFAGDSMMQGVAPWAMRDLQSRYHIASIDLSKQSTGLSYSSFFDWPATIEQTIEQNPDIGVLVMFLGANDPWAVPNPEQSGGKYIAFGTPEWNALYRAKINRIMTAAKNNQVQVIWITPPTMKSTKLNKEMMTLTKLYVDSIPNTQALLLDAKTALSDTNDPNTYHDSLPIDGKLVKVRTSDGIHFTSAGQKRLASLINDHIKVNNQPTLIATHEDNTGTQPSISDDNTHIKPAIITGSQPNL